MGTLRTFMYLLSTTVLVSPVVVVLALATPPATTRLATDSDQDMRFGDYTLTNTSHLQLARDVSDDNSHDASNTNGLLADMLHLCDVGRHFDNLDSIQAASSDLPPQCIAMHTLDVLADMLDTAIDNYTSIDDGYDAEFSYYITYMKNLIPQILSDQLMFNVSAIHTMDKFVPLGQDLPRHDSNLEQFETTIRLRDVNGYNKALDTFGVSRDWTDFGDYTLIRNIDAVRANRKYQYKFHGFPVENATMVLPNPKDLITKGLGKIDDLQLSLYTTLGELQLGVWIGSLEDVVQAYSVPVFMYIQAIENMAQAKALGQQEQKKEEDEERERKENLIILILSVVLMFVPVVGEELGAVTGMAGLARGIAIGSELAQGAVAVYDSVHDPTSALLNVLGMMFGAGAIAKTTRDAKGMSAVAKIRQGLKPEVIHGMGALFKTHDDKVQGLMRTCKLPL